MALTAGDNPNNEDKQDLWLVTGGLIGSTPLSRIEAFDGEGWNDKAVKNLPVPVYLHCFVSENAPLALYKYGLASIISFQDIF